MAEQIQPGIQCPNPQLPAGAQGIARVAVDDAAAELIVTFRRPVAQGYLVDPRSYRLTGGQRLFPRILGAERYDPPGSPADMLGHHVRLALDAIGDFSIYTLTVGGPDVDPFFASHKLRFRLDCDDPFDCRGALPAAPAEPEIPVAVDYLARDYAGFRQALLDFIPTRMPGWTERSEADLGMMLLELFAATADQLSYLQDRVANEAFLSTATQRRSVAGHLALVGYEIDEGAAAYTWLQFQVDALHTLSAGAGRPGFAVTNRVRYPGEPVVVFETAGTTTLRPEHGEMRVYAWGNQQCCLPRAALTVALAGAYPDLQAGDFLLFDDGNGQRDVVRLVDRPHVLPLSQVPPHLLSPLAPPPARSPAPSQPAHITVVRWSKATPLHHDYCLGDGFVVRGNLVLATHGETIQEQIQPREQVDRARARLSRAPLAHLDPAAVELARPLNQPVASTAPGLEDRAVPLSTLQIEVDGLPWQQRRTLLDSRPDSAAYQVEVDDEGEATVVFGDGTLGKRLPDGAAVTATYRVGGGAAGNVAAGTLTVPRPRANEDVSWLQSVTNPLPARGGRDLESSDHARRFGPASVQKRLVAVTAADYEEAALELADPSGRKLIQRAKAAFRWTGSWLTVTLIVDPVQAEGLDAELRARLHEFLEARRLAGYDLEIVPARYLPVELAVDVCLSRGFYAGDVRQRLQRALGNAMLPDGGRGFFHPDNFSLGDPLYVGQLYAAIMVVAGVDSAEIVTLARLRSAWPDPETKANLRQGYLAVGEDEIVRLDNDPNFPENGRLSVRVKGESA